MNPLEISRLIEEVDELQAELPEISGQLLQREILILSILDRLRDIDEAGKSAATNDRICQYYRELISIREEMNRSNIEILPGEQDFTESADNLPADGGTFHILNPFVDVDNPSPRLTAEATASAGRFGAQAKFTARTDNAVRWRLELIQTLPSSGPWQSALYRIRSVILPDDPDPRLFAYRGPYLVRSNIARFDASSEPRSIWRVDTLDGFIFLFSDPENGAKRLYSRFGGRTYYPNVGRPNQIAAADIRLTQL